MNCSYCCEELFYHDFYGYIAGPQRGEKLGDIFKCHNEECDSQVFNGFFFTKKQNSSELYEGHPC
jgi:hypothetical protein